MIKQRALLTFLSRHQKQALTFMVRREKGWLLETKGADVWEILDSSRDVG